MRHLYAFFFILVGSSSLHSQLKEEVAILDDSKNWPDRIALTQNFTISREDGKPEVVEVGREVILLRIEKEAGVVDYMAVVDFGREGVQSLPSGMTDVGERALKIRNGETTKEFPNWTMLLGRSTATVESGGYQVELKSLLRYENMLIIYVGSLEEFGQTIASVLDEHRDLLAATDTMPLILHTGDTIPTQGDYAKELKAAGVSAYFILPFLSKPYAGALGHNVAINSAAVLVDVDGATITDPDPLLSLELQFESCLESLSQFVEE